jgi:ankyrin repeat protein
MKLGASPQYSLYAAASNRDTDAIRPLVRYGADIEEPSGSGQTPLLSAVGWSHIEAAEAMLQSGANVRPPTWRANATVGFTTWQRRRAGPRSEANARRRGRNRNHPSVREQHVPRVSYVIAPGGRR